MGLFDLSVQNVTILFILRALKPVPKPYQKCRMVLLQSTFNKKVICMININIKCVKVSKYSDQKKKYKTFYLPYQEPKTQKWAWIHFQSNPAVTSIPPYCFVSSSVNQLPKTSEKNACRNPSNSDSYYMNHTLRVNNLKL